ncbi:hypothetical protein Tco_0910466 [Tanacetum coccineum]|uniref:Uncharacterized protein n=1 Tax=Tanacetum coccineum TaxID=301880 RepID=A0ABQ5CSY7_9ASTR
MTTLTKTTSNSQMRNDIMTAGSKVRLPMLATGRYTQWQSHFLRYVDTKPNKKELRQCIFDVGEQGIVPEKAKITLMPRVLKQFIIDFEWN